VTWVTEEDSRFSVSHIAGQRFLRPCSNYPAPPGVLGGKSQSMIVTTRGHHQTAECVAPVTAMVRGELRKIPVSRGSVHKSQAEPATKS
jgi:hypothetical protein